MNLAPTGKNSRLTSLARSVFGARGKAILSGVVILLLAGLGWNFYHPAANAPTERGRSGGGPTPVVVATVQSGEMPVTLDALGTVTALATVAVKTQISGQLTQIAFQEGQDVTAGQFLAQIDPRPYQAQLEQYQGQLQRDSALLNAARVDLDRYQRLVEEDSIARQQLDSQAALVKQYEGVVATDKAQVETAKLNLTYCHIVAPVSGRIGLRLVDQGNYLQPSDTNNIAVITQLHPISVLFTLAEDNLPPVLKRISSGATLAVTAFDRAAVTQLGSGKLATVDNQIDTSTGTVKLRALFDNSERQLFPNQFVTVQLKVDTLKDVKTIPIAAVQRGAPGTFVYLVKPDNTVTVRPIKLGPGSGDRITVLSGIDTGDSLVVDGADKLREGAAVTIPAQNAPPPSEGEHHHRPKN
ncbi:MAG TPA: efflux RND transporter periplasmic adaptor subunit [Rhodospirillaceae bacterium]|nr:efflux RND transporter periplasmic adaptor subunit [Rhodospirillaceae bacterium]